MDGQTEKWMDRQRNGWWAEKWRDRWLDAGVDNSTRDAGQGHCAERRLSTHIRQLADGVCFDCDVVLLQLLLDFINALRDILCLKGKKC